MKVISFIDKNTCKLTKLKKKIKTSQAYLIEASIYNDDIFEKCVVKTYKDKSITSDFLKESCLLRNLSHPNLIKTYGVVSSMRFHPQVIMQHGGCDLAHFSSEISFSQRMSIFDTIFTQILEGVRYLHSFDITHGDIKPDNITIDNGVARICDFGGIQFGTVNINCITYTSNYAAPEILRKDGNYNASVDMWSIVCTFYVFLFRSYLFPGNNNGIILQSIDRCDIISIHRRFKFSAHVDSIIKMLDTDPYTRLVNTVIGSVNDTISDILPRHEIYNTKRKRYVKKIFEDAELHNCELRAGFIAVDILDAYIMNVNKCDITHNLYDIAFISLVIASKYYDEYPDITEHIHIMGANHIERMLLEVISYKIYPVVLIDIFDEDHAMDMILDYKCLVGKTYDDLVEIADDL